MLMTTETINTIQRHVAHILADGDPSDIVALVSYMAQHGLAEVELPDNLPVSIDAYPSWIGQVTIGDVVYEAPLDHDPFVWAIGDDDNT